MPGLTRRAAIAIPIFGLMAGTLPITAAAQVKDGANSMVVGGVLAYLGVLPAAIVRGHPKSHPEGKMHGGFPEGKHQYHLVLALFEAASGKRIESAQVSVTVMGLGHVGGTRLELETMSIADTVTWGTFVELPGRDFYDLVFEVVLPGQKTALSFPFRYSHSSY